VSEENKDILKELGESDDPILDMAKKEKKLSKDYLDYLDAKDKLKAEEESKKQKRKRLKTKIGAMMDLADAAFKISEAKVYKTPRKGRTIPKLELPEESGESAEYLKAKQKLAKDYRKMREKQIDLDYESEELRSEERSKRKQEKIEAEKRRQEAAQLKKTEKLDKQFYDPDKIKKSKQYKDEQRVFYEAIQPDTESIDGEDVNSLLEQTLDTDMGTIDLDYDERTKLKDAVGTKYKEKVDKVKQVIQENSKGFLGLGLVGTDIKGEALGELDKALEDVAKSLVNLKLRASLIDAKKAGKQISPSVYKEAFTPVELLKFQIESPSSLIEKYGYEPREVAEFHEEAKALIDAEREQKLEEGTLGPTFDSRNN
jgi:hypothetical protein